MSDIIFENNLIKVEIEPSQIPWLKNDHHRSS